MALIPCPECKTEVSDKAKACPKCGYPLSPKPDPAPVSSPPAPPKLRTIPRNSEPPPLLPPLSTSKRPPMAYAGFIERFFAYFVDEFIIVTAIILLIGVLVAVGGGNPGETIAQNYVDWVKSFFGWVSEDRPLLMRFVGHLIGFAIRLFYFAKFESSAWQATPGKRLLKLKVMDEAGDRIGFGLALWRYSTKLLSSIILGIGYLMIIWTRRKQGLHDMLALTVVCSSAEGPSQSTVDDRGERTDSPYSPLRYTE